ncbi:ribosomal protein L2, partial [Mycena rebaudengoi]
QKTLHPTFPAQSATWDFPVFLSTMSVLELVVWDKDVLKRDYLGEVGVPVEAWFGDDEQRWEANGNVDYQARVVDTDAATHATVVSAIRYTFAKMLQSYDELLAPLLVDYGALAHTSGNYATVIGHSPDDNKTRIRLPNNTKKTISGGARATIGIVAYGGRINKPLGHSYVCIGKEKAWVSGSSRCFLSGLLRGTVKVKEV